MALALAVAGIPVMGEDEPVSTFVGTLEFEVKHDNISMPLRYYSDGKHLRIELGKEGQPSRVWLTGLEELDGVVAISPIKMSYTLEPDRPMRQRGPRGDGSEGDKERPREAPGFADLPEPEITEVNGLPCRRYILKTEGPDTELWVLENAQPFPMAVMSMWSGLRDALPQVSKACREADGLPLQVLRKNWRGKEQFSIKLVSTSLEMPEASMFSIPAGYFRTRSSSRMSGGGGARSGGRPSGGGRGGPGGGRP
ncbi:MAG: DUF4412 domain-containing protein [Puniceicoccaceae bacterium]